MDGCAGAAEAAAVPEVSARALRDYALERTPERRARGEYLVEGLLQCFVCHSELDWEAPGAPPAAGRKDAGKVIRADAERRLVASNLTPDVETGAGACTDDMLARAIREGVGHDGRPLHPQMGYRSFRSLADEDLAAVIVYLRSIPAARNALPPTLLRAQERAAVGGMPQPLTAPVAGPDSADTLARGRYLVRLADCEGCHTSWHSPRMPGRLAGGNEIERDGRAAFSTNVTPDPTGAGYDAAAFIAVIRGGKGGTLSGLMPWIVFRNLTDGDLTALHTALHAVQPVRHYIDNRAPRTARAVCGQRHGRGHANVLETPPGVAVDCALYDDSAGSFRSVEYGVTIAVVRAGGRLTMQEEGGAAIELIPQSPSRFLAPGGLAPVSFERDGRGRVLRLVSHEIEDIAFERVDSSAPAAGD